MSATSDTHAGPGVLEVPRPAGMRALLIWIGLSLLGFPLGGYLGHAIAGSVDSVTPALIGGALTGASIGLALWVGLRRNPGVGPGWILATSVALAFGLAIRATAVGYETTTSRLVIMGAISGATVGIAQGSLLRGKFSLWHVWMVAMPALWAPGLGRDCLGRHQHRKPVHCLRCFGSRCLWGLVGTATARRSGSSSATMTMPDEAR